MEYRTFTSAKSRCAGAKSASTHRYEGRIEFRFDSFEQFFEELGPRPEGHEIDRINNEGHYEPGNVRWVTRKQNLNNRSITIKITYNGQTKPLSVWAEELGLNYYRTRSRHNAGMAPEQILSKERLPQRGTKSLLRRMAQGH